MAQSLTHPDEADRPATRAEIDALWQAIGDVAAGGWAEFQAGAAWQRAHPGHLPNPAHLPHSPHPSRTSRPGHLRRVQ